MQSSFKWHPQVIPCCTFVSFSMHVIPALCDFHCPSSADLTGSTPPATHDECVQVESTLRDRASPLCDAAAADAWRARCQGVFCWSGVFEGAHRVPLSSLTRAPEPEAAEPGTPNGKGA